MAAFVIDVGNGAEHRRHLQLQADAGALAAAQEFNGCFLDEDRGKQRDRGAATEYSGGTHNPQIGAGDAQARVQTRVNATSYTTPLLQRRHAVRYGLRGREAAGGELAAAFRVPGRPRLPRPRAREGLRAADSNKLLPIAVPDPDPKVAARSSSMRARPTTGTLASTPLTQERQRGRPDDLGQLHGAGQRADKRRARRGAGRARRRHLHHLRRSGRECYDAGSSHGIVHIRGWTAAGTGGAEDADRARASRCSRARAGRLLHARGLSCAVGVNATVDFGVPNPVTTLGATVAATVGSTSPAHLQCRHVERTSAIPIAPGAGPPDVGLLWRDRQECRWSQLQRTPVPWRLRRRPARNFGAHPDRSGPIALAEVSEGGDMTNTLQRCSTVLHHLHATTWS